MAATSIRAFVPADADAVRSLFVEVNHLLAPVGMEAAFESYIERCIEEEIGRVADYYGERGGGFWVATADGAIPIVGMFGLEPASPDAMELRRMYVAPTARRVGVATAMLAFAERECLRLEVDHLVLSTSELQPEAMALYRSRGYIETGMTVADESSNRTVGGGIRRYGFAKLLPIPAHPPASAPNPSDESSSDGCESVHRS